MSDVYGRKPPFEPHLSQDPIKFDYVQICMSLVFGVILLVWIKLGHDAVEAHTQAYESRLAELRAISQEARDRAEARRLAAGGLPVATTTPMPARTRPYLQYGSVQSLAEVNTWCADPNYDWKLVACTPGAYILVRTVK